MWLSESKRQGDLESTEAAMGRYYNGESELLCFGNAVSIPNEGAVCVLLDCSDGSRLCLGTPVSELPEDLEPGEVYIKSDSAEIILKNNGGIELFGDVNIIGTLKINGMNLQ